ncbi:MAG TPA: ParA family partition ATPase [Kofleriaceae bacterium]
MKTIVCAAVKGGAGKTTLATNLGAELLRRKHRVLIVDADPQGTARTWCDVAAENGLPTPTCVSMGKEMHQPGQLDRLGAAFDYVIIDCPGRDGIVVRAALMTAHLVLIPCGTSPADAWALQQSLSLVEEARALRPYLDARVVLTRRRAATNLGRNARADLVALGVPLLTGGLTERVAYQTAMGDGKGVTSLTGQAEAVREIRSLADEILSLLMESNDGAQAHVA